MLESEINIMNNIMIFSKEFPPNIIGGTAIVARSAAQGLLKLNYSVTVVTNSDRTESHVEIIEGIKIIFIENSTIYHTKSGLDDSNIRYHKKVLEILKRFNVSFPDIILVPDLFSFPEAYVFSKKHNIPLVNILLQDFRKMILYDKGKTHKVTSGANGFAEDLLRIEKKSIAVSDVNVFISHALSDSICSYYKPDKNRCRVIYLGINKSEINGAYYNKTDNIRNQICSLNRKIVMSIGRMVPVKGFDKLIKAFELVRRNYPEVYLCILGRGPEEKYLSELIKELKLQESVKLMYEPNRNKVMALMNSCDIAVVPSLWESFCYVAAEFMALGKPLVACGVDSLNELVINKKTGLICPVEEIQNKRQINERILSDYIQILLNDHALATQLGIAARERALKIFNEERFAIELAELVESLRVKK